MCYDQVIKINPLDVDVWKSKRSEFLELKIRPTIRILFLSANPVDTPQLKVIDEYSRISDKVRAGI